jgi:hypothetical protein
VFVGALAVVLGVAFVAACVYIVVRARGEFLATAFGTEIEVAPTVFGAMLGVLGDWHSADDIDHGICTRLSMMVIRMCGALVAMRGAAAATCRVSMFAVH